MKSDDRLFKQAKIACLCIMGASALGMLILGNRPLDAPVPAETPATVLEAPQPTDSVQVELDVPAQATVPQSVVITYTDMTPPPPTITVVEPQPVIINVPVETAPPPEPTVPTPQQWTFTTQPQLQNQSLTTPVGPQYAIYYTDLPQSQSQTTSTLIIPQLTTRYIYMPDQEIQHGGHMNSFGFSNDDITFEFPSSGSSDDSSQSTPEPTTEP